MIKKRVKYKCCNDAEVQKCEEGSAYEYDEG